MTCSTCGEKPENTAKDFTNAVIEINNPESLILFRKVVIPVSMGDESVVPPEIGKYYNVLLHYEASNNNYLYSSDGIPTLLTTEIPEEIQRRWIMAYDNVEAMKKSKNIISESFVETYGFYSKGDGGSCKYKIRKISPSDVVDEMTIIAIEGTSLVAEIIPSPIMTVKQFGIHGDGEHEEGAKINAVISFLSGKTIIFPEGTYILETPINIPEKTIIKGESAKTILKAKDNIDINDNLIKLESISQSEIHSLVVDGNRGNQDEGTYTQYGVMVSGCENVIVESVIAKNINGVGIQVYNSKYVTILSSEGSHCRYHAFECEQCQDTVFTACYGHDNDRHGIFVSPGEVGGTGSINNIVDGCTFNNNSQYGIAFGIDAQGISVGLTRNNIISNCVVHNNTYYGISIYKVDRVTVSACDINGNGAFGIYLYQAKECSIIGNRLQDDSSTSSGAYDEICIEGYADGSASLHNLISNNIIQPSKARYAIQEANAGDGPNVIVNNYVYSNGVSGKYNIQNTSTYYDRADVELADQLSSLRKFKGIMIDNPCALPSGMGIDSPFTDVLRIVNNNGSTQISNSNPSSSVDFYINGNSEFTVSASDVDLHSNNLKNYTDLGGWIVSPPGSWNASGIAGMRAYDANYLYICVATDVWRRVAFDPWS